MYWAFQAAWNIIVNIVKVGAALVLAVILGPFLAIGALFVWLYNHNYYFKALIDAIVNFVKAGVSWLQNAWATVTDWIVSKWNFLKTMATLIFQYMYTTIREKITQAQQIIQSVWNTIVGVFQGAWGRISGALSGLWSGISGWFGNLASQAVQWGANLITGFINGIKNMIGGVASAIGNVANTIKNILGFHSPPPEGPAKDSDTWAPNLVNMLNSGMLAGVPKLRGTAGLLAQALTVGGGTSPGSSLSVGTSPGTSGIPGTMNLTIQLDSREIANATGIRTAKEMRIQGRVRNR